MSKKSCEAAESIEDAQCGNLKSVAYATCRTCPKGALLRLDHNQFFRIQCTLHHFIDAVL